MPGGVTSEIADRGRIDPGLLIKSPALKGRVLLGHLLGDRPLLYPCRISPLQ